MSAYLKDGNAYNNQHCHLSVIQIILVIWIRNTVLITREVNNQLLVQKAIRHPPRKFHQNAAVTYRVHPVHTQTPTTALTSPPSGVIKFEHYLPMHNTTALQH